MTMPDPGARVPRAFVSYSWDDDAHKDWVRDLAARLRGNGVDVTLDRWHAAPGDQIPAFMERAVRDNDFVIAICTPGFKARSDGRAGGVGYEGDIMTAYTFVGDSEKKFIPVLRRGKWTEAAPTWLLGRAKIDLSGDPYSRSAYDELLRTLHGAREKAPPLGPRPDFEHEQGSRAGDSPHGTGLPPPRSGGATKPRGRDAGIWPYRVDRQEQVEDLMDAIRAADECRRPLICLVVGTTQDDHPGLVERVVRHDFGPSTEKVVTDFPSLEWAVDEKRFELAYLGGLGKQLPGSCKTIESLAGFLRLDPRRWVIVSMVELAPDDPRNPAVLRSVAGFWTRVGEHLGEVPPDRLPLAWLQVVPAQIPPRRRLWPFGGRPADPKLVIHAQMKPVSLARCFRPLGLVRRSHLEDWSQRLDQDPRWSDAGRIDLKPLLDLFPDETVTRPMSQVRATIARLIEGRERDDT